MSALQVIILAAGEGTRMKSEMPKVLHPICGRPMIAYAIDLAAALGVKQPIVVLGERANEIKSHLPKEAKVIIQQKALGTGDAVLATKRAVGSFSGDLLILYADTPLLRRTTIQRLVEGHHRANAACTLLTTHLADPTGYGRIVRDATGVMTGVVEEVEANALQRAIREINAGPMCAKAPLLFEALAQVKPGHVGKEWYLTQAISILAKRDGTKFQTVRIEKVVEALGVNSRLELAKATGMIRQRILEAHLNNGVTIVDLQATYIDHGVTIGQDTVIFPGSVIEPGVSIGKRCSIGPFARLRAGVTIGDETRIGNFTELVRTKVGNSVRMNHVSYLGDALVDDGANIGAGSITANFDGTEKVQTTIGKGAFIGCDTILIAPVSVGARAVTGAGSVIPKGHDVPAGGLVVGVPARAIERQAQTDGHRRTMTPPRSSKASKASTKSPAKRDGVHPKPRVRIAKARMTARRPSVKAKKKVAAKRKR